MEFLISIFTDANTQWVMTGTLLLGLASGVLGSFALLKKQSLIGDAMAHAALPGICIAFLIDGAKSMTLFMVGAAIAGLVATYFIQSIVQYSRIKEDTSIGLVLSVFFGFGIVLLTFINHNGNGNQSGLDDFIFGQAASLVGSDVKIISSIAAALLIITFLLFKELKIITFDPQFAKGIGLPTGLLNFLLMTLIVGAVVVGLQAVGVILMAAMLITPAIAARYWTERLDRMVIISGLIGAISGILGTLLSTTANGMATGPLIIMAATIVFIISFLFAPNRGLVSKLLRVYKVRKITAREQVLQTIYDFTEESMLKRNSTYLPSIKEEDFYKKRSFSTSTLKNIIRQFVQEGLIHEVELKRWKFTMKGLKEAHQITLKNRLYEVYFMHEMQFAHLNLGIDGNEDIFNIPKHYFDELLHLLKENEREPLLINLLSVELKKDFSELAVLSVERERKVKTDEL